MFRKVTMLDEEGNGDEENDNVWEMKMKLKN